MKCNRVCSSSVFLWHFIFMQLLCVVQVRATASPLPKVVNMSFAVRWCLQCVTNYKNSHMPFPSPQEHHLTLKCCISALRWEPGSGVPALRVATRRPLADAFPLLVGGQAAWGPWILWSSQEVVPIKNMFIVLKFSQHPFGLFVCLF